MYKTTRWIRQCLSAALLTYLVQGNAMAQEPTALEQLRKDHAAFGFSLYKKANPQRENLVFSPLSIATGLSMLYVGARGQTQEQIRQALKLSIDPEKLSKLTCQLTESLQAKSPSDHNYHLITTNALFVDLQTFLLTSFHYQIEKQFKAHLNMLSFAEPQHARDTINQWIRRHTQNQIKDLLTPTDITSLTRLVLVNTLFLKGQWKRPFDPSNTHEEPFWISENEHLPVKMMQQSLLTPYYENDLLQLVALPLVGSTQGGGELAMVIVLPKSTDNLPLVINELPSQYAQWLSSGKLTRLDLKIPLWTERTTLPLTTLLKQIGVTDAFNAQADFSGMDGMRDLKLNEAVHQTFLTVDESGLSASSATALSMGITSTGAPPITCYADHPFVYLVVDLQSQEILLMGLMASPQQHAKES